MGQLKAICRFCGRWVWWLIAFANLVIGFAGVPGDLETWARWIDIAVNDPLVVSLAGHAVAAAEFINQFWVRTLLVIVGLTILGWGWRPFWNMRHRLLFRWRRALADEVWISWDDAYKILLASDWANLRRPHISVFGGALVNALRGFDSDTGYNRDMKLFHHFCRRTMKSFATNNPNSVRVVEGKTQYREGSLREFLDVALDDEAIEKFGNVPGGSVE